MERGSAIALHQRDDATLSTPPACHLFSCGHPSGGARLRDRSPGLGHRQPPVQSNGPCATQPWPEDCKANGAAVLARKASTQQKGGVLPSSFARLRRWAGGCRRPTSRWHSNQRLVRHRPLPRDSTASVSKNGPAALRPRWPCALGLAQVPGRSAAGKKSMPFCCASTAVLSVTVPSLVAKVTAFLLCCRACRVV